MRLSEAKAWFYDCRPSRGDMRKEVLEGLRSSPKWLSPKYFYDAPGSRLFDAITALPEYYPSRIEFGLLRRNGAEIAAAVPADCTLIEYGCGNIRKVRLILDQLRPGAYVPLDISGEQLRRCAVMLAEEFPWLEVHAACVDYSRQVELPVPARAQPRVAFFPGSSIGNFTPEEALGFLRRVRQTVGDDGCLLIGIDLVKPRAVLEAAYDDVQGVTAAFNRNLLVHINRELGGNLQPRQFQHVACFNAAASRIEMYLQSRIDQVARIAGERVAFHEGEQLLTESSHKYTVASFQRLAKEAGFSLRHDWQDQQGWYAMLLLDAD